MPHQFNVQQRIGGIGGAGIGHRPREAWVVGHGGAHGHDHWHTYIWWVHMSMGA